MSKFNIGDEVLYAHNPSDWVGTIIDVRRSVGGNFYSVEWKTGKYVQEPTGFFYKDNELTSLNKSSIISSKQIDWLKLKQRNPDRIDPIIDQIRTIWQSNPDLRLGQLIASMMGTTEDLFEREDSYWLNAFSIDIPLRSNE